MTILSILDRDLLLWRTDSFFYLNEDKRWVLDQKFTDDHESNKILSKILSHHG